MRKVRGVMILGIGVMGIVFSNINAEEWAKTFGGTGFDGGESVQETKDGGFIITGWTASFGAGQGDVYLIRTDEHGDTLWTRTYGGVKDDEGYSVQETKDGGFIITGFTCSFGAGKEDVYLIRTNSEGDTLWTKTFGGIDSDGGRSVQETNDGGFIIAGYTMSFGAGYGDVYLVRVNEIGVEETEDRSQKSEVRLEVYPNPFIKTTEIRAWGLGVSEKQEVKIYDITGKLVEEARFFADAQNDRLKIGKNLSPGIYFVKLKGLKPVKIVKMGGVR
ncbi:MAG: T9SS type A sorting domain-containing protein [Candidatus Stahlbacteria bacterium]|nr:T9SS type A sorting domain-containing protein [Candidatus Stahlbacteria bacterium]